MTKNPKIKLPARWTNTQVRVNEKGKVQVRMNPAKVGTGRVVKNATVKQNQHWRRGKDGKFHEVMAWPPKKVKKAKGTYRKSKYARNRRKAA